MKRPLLTLLAAALLGGCPKNPSEPGATHPPVSRPGPATRPAAPPSAPAPTVQRRADAVPAVAITIDPGRWTRLAAVLRPLVADLPARGPLRQRLLQLLEAPDLWDAARKVISLSLTRAALPARLDGWDPTRPLTLELFDPVDAGDLALAARVLIIPPSVSWVPGACHRLRLPATDAATASASLRQVLEGAGLEPVRTRDGRRGVLYRGRDALAAVLPEQRQVRVEVCRRPVVLEGKSADADALWQRQVLLAPGRGSLPRTPALRLVREGTALANVHVRPWVFRQLSEQQGAYQIVRALTSADPAYRAMLLAAGLAEVAIGHLLMTPVAAEVDDASVAVDASSGKLRLTTVWSLTEQGQRVYRAATRGAAPTFPVTDRDAVLRGWIALDVPAMLGAAQPHPLFVDAKRPREVAQPLQEAGYWGMFHAAMRHQVSLLQALARVSPLMRHPLTAHGPRGLSVALRGPGRFSAALSVTPGRDVARMKNELERLLARLGLSRLTVHARRHDDDGALLIGLGQDPRRAFGRRPRRGPAGVLADLQVNAAALRRLARRQNPLAAASLTRLGGARTRLLLRGRALVGQLELGVGRDGPDKLAAPPDLSVDGWTSPGLARAASPGGRCLARMTRGMASAFRAVAMADTATKGQLILRALDEVSGELGCAERDPLTREEARRLRGLLDLFRADQLGGLFKRREQLALLGRACARGMRAACARKQAVEAAPRVQLASRADRCGQPHALALLGPGDRAHFMVSANGELHRGELGPWRPVLLADRNAPARAVVRAVQTAGQRDPVRLLFRGEAGGLRELQVVSAKRRPRGDETKRLVRPPQPRDGSSKVRVPKGTWQQALEAVCTAAGREPREPLELR